MLASGCASAPAYASCAFAPDDPELVRIADVIFTGEIVSNTVSGWRRQRQIVFAVDRVYKGQAHAEQLVVSATGSSVSGSSVSLGREISGSGRFLVQAQYGDAARRPGVLTTNTCLGSRAGDAPASLGSGYPPVPGSTIPSSKRYLTSGAGLAGLVLLILAAGSGILLARRQSRLRRS